MGTICLPQGDPASPLGLWGPIAEALLRLRSESDPRDSGQVLWGVFLDDRQWLTKDLSTCLSVGQRWAQEVSNMGMDENKSKADYCVVGTKLGREAMKNAIRERNMAGTVKFRPKILGCVSKLTGVGLVLGPRRRKRIRLDVPNSWRSGLS